MAGTLAIIIGLSTLAITVILILAGVFDLLTLGVIVVAFNILQWLVAPYMVDAIYKVRALPESENPQLHQVVSNISQKSGITKPKLMLAQIPLPNAFAYGSPLAGSRIAVTQGLLKSLDEGEVEAVIGHELGHLKHRDMQVMMAIAVLQMKMTPAEALTASTINAAHSIERAREIGSLEVGKKADIIMFDAPNHKYFAYHYGVNLAEKVFKDGKLVAERGRRIE